MALTIRTVTLRETETGVEVTRLSTAIPGYSPQHAFHNPASFRTMAEARTYYESYGYAECEGHTHDGMLTLQRTTD